MILVVRGTHDQKTIDQLADVEKDAEFVSLMADGHLGYHMPIGGVAAYKNKVSVTGVGFDIACGNCAVLTDLMLDSLGDRTRIEEFASSIQAEISFGLGRKNRSDDAPVDAPLFSDERWGLIPEEFREDLRDKARGQLGTVGSGNHYVDIFSDTKGRIWVGVHFGSRGLGHTIASNFLALEKGQKWGDRVPETGGAVLDLNTSLGGSYWHLMGLAGEYAYAGREWVAGRVTRLLGGKVVSMVHNHHNFAWREQHFGQDLVVVRKGATPAFPGQRGFVGGSMGDDAVILEGTDWSKWGEFSGEFDNKYADQAMNMFSTVHGAGRVMSRNQAAGKHKLTKGYGCRSRDCDGFIPKEKGAHAASKGTEPSCPKCGGETGFYHRSEQLRAGAVDAKEVAEWLAGRGVVLRGGGLDEAPQAYRRLPDVLAAQGSTVTVLETLKPLIVVMAGSDVQDPYGD